MVEPIPTELLRLCDVPSPAAAWGEINDFAHTFDGYRHWGSFERCEEVALNSTEMTLDDLRASLFYFARAVRHSGYGPSDRELLSVQNLLRRIRSHERFSTFQGQSESAEYGIPELRFDRLEYIEERVARADAADQGSLRTALTYLYLTDGPINLPRERLKAAEQYLEPRERVLIRWLYTRTNGSERKRYGMKALLQARSSRYRCESCGYSDVRALELDHVSGRVEETDFACLCANCHTIKSRAEDWSGKPRYDM